MNTIPIEGLKHNMQAHYTTLTNARMNTIPIEGLKLTHRPVQRRRALARMNTIPIEGLKPAMMRCVSSSQKRE